MAERHKLPRTPFWLIGNLQARLLLLFAFLLLLAIGVAGYFNDRTESLMIQRIQKDVEEVTQAVQLSVQQLNPEVASDRAVLEDYLSQLRSAQGVQEVSVLDTSRAVIASTNPMRVGTRIEAGGKPAKPKHEPKQLVIEERLGGPSPGPGEKLYEVTVPIAGQGAAGIGYVHVEMTLDDYALMLRKNHRRNMLVYSGLFILGLLISFGMARRFASPIEKLAQASQRVAAGDLSVSVSAVGKDEVAHLSEAFNEMVSQLRKKEDLEEELRSLERTKALGEMAQSVAHEIRNPLNLINLSVGFLGDKFQPSEEGKSKEYGQLVKEIKGEVTRLNELVRSFLELGKPSKLHLEPYPVESLLQDVASLAGHQAGQRGVELARENETGTFVAFLDPAQIRIGLLNLVNNALEATPPGGTVTIRATAGSEDGKKSLCLEVTDSGTGIPEENLGMIFEPYFTTKEGGMGIGLAIARRIVEDHGGRLDVENRHEGGALFRFCLPLGTEL